MLYFTKELWAGWQDDDIAGLQEDVDKRVKEYWRQFERLEPRLGNQTAKFLRTARLHDSKLINE